MRKLGLGFLLLASASVVHAQLDSNSVTVTASRPAAVEPDEVVFAVTVSSAVNTGLDQIVAAVQAVGITASNLSSVNTASVVFGVQSTSVLQWTFALPVPFKNMKNVTASLAALQQTISQSNSGLTLAFNVVGTQASPQLLLAQQCSIPDLLADATAQAQKLASAAGLFIGPVVALAQGDSGPLSSQRLNVRPVVVAPTGSFLVGVPLTVPAPVPECSIAVKFSLLRFH